MDNDQLTDAIALYDSNKFTEAKTEFEILELEHCDNGGNPEICFETNIHLLLIARRTGHTEEAEQVAERTDRIVRNRLDDSAFYRAKLAMHRLYLADQLNNLERAEHWTNILRSILEENSDDSHALAIAHNAVGYYEDVAGNYPEAIHHYNMAIDRAENVDSIDETGKLLIQIHNNLGVSYKHMGSLEKAKDHYDRSLELIYNVHGDEHREIATSFNNLGSIYYSQGDIGLAAEYFLRAAEMFQSLYGENHREAGAALNNVGVSYHMLKNYEKSAEYIERAQRIKETNLGYDHPETAVGYSNLASIHILNKDYKAARENIELSISVRENIYGADHPNLIDPKVQLGNLYSRQIRDYEKARESYQSALRIAKKRLGENHPDVSDIYLQLGIINIEIQKYSEGEEYLDRAMKLLYGNYDLSQPIDLERAISDPVKLVSVLSNTARLYKERNDTVVTEDYQRALMALDWAADLVDVLLQSFKNEASKLQLIENHYSIYTNAVEILAVLYRETESEEYIQRIFEFIEKSRSRIALELIQKLNAQNYAGVPEEILEEESRINMLITQFQQQLFEEQEKGLEGESTRSVMLRDSIFQKKRELEEFTRQLEEQFPMYYSLKYDQSVTNLPEAQSLLNEGETVLSYVLGTDKTYVLAISNADVNIIELGNTAEIDEHILKLKEHVLSGNPEEYKKLAHALYQFLIEPIEPHLNSEKLLIMADQKLHYLPFEMLLTELPDHNDFHKFSYLLRDYTISYIPSLTLLGEMNTTTSENPRNLLAVAPFSNDIGPDDQAFMDHRYAGNVSPLLLTRYETTSISDHFRSRRTWTEYLRPQQTRLLMGNEATYSSFSETTLTDYNFIHFATHAFINEENPEYSGILLYPEEGNSGVAYVGDIYNMQLNADLVVLGACQTGLGSIYKGEGLIGFTRAFIYAGASNLAVSMWKVSDQPTAYLMIDFYDLIRQGYGYSEALRQAKLNLIDKPQFSDPVNWAAFMLTGR